MGLGGGDRRRRGRRAVLERRHGRQHRVRERARRIAALEADSRGAPSSAARARIVAAISP